MSSELAIASAEPCRSLRYGINTSCPELPSVPVCDNDLSAKKRVLLAHIHKDCSSTIRQDFFLCLARQPDESIRQLYLDERHIDWMSDVVLQHVLADLRPLIVPKLQTEKDVHFGPGATPGNKRGTVEVHRGETYQFAYFFRKTEPHTVLFKSRHFVTAPLRPEGVPKSAPPRVVDQNPQKKRLRTHVSIKQSKRKRAKTKGKDKISQSHLDEDEWSAEDSEEDTDDADLIPREPRPVRKQRRIITDAYQEDKNDVAEDTCLDVTMDSPPPEMDGGSSRDPVDQSSPAVKDGDADACSSNDQPNFSPDMVDIELVVEEEEKKPKPLLKLKYQSFPISGHCLCVVVEPWPPLPAETRLQTLGTSVQRGSLEPALLPSNGSIVAGQRAKTPLFFPEYDRAPSEAPFARQRTLPPVPLFHDAMSRAEDDDYSDDDLMNFSQTLNAAGHMHAITADDDDDMDGAILFGDADEIRELF
ncbi:hypothetical protein J3R83DRAFT_837 [Lanmaoa asiatica]|nr:hypothetical protein J3R83DRAFT_837 [Lanmaoa asiatica]